MAASKPASPSANQSTAKPASRSPRSTNPAIASSSSTRSARIHQSVARAFHAGVSGLEKAALPLKGVGHFDEDLMIRWHEAPQVGELAIVPVADEHHRLPVDLVREQHRPVERAVVCRRRLQVQSGIPIGRLILPDDAYKAARGERVVGADALDARRK